MVSNGTAPTTCRQLKNMLGVPLAPTAAASFWSSSTRALAPGPALAALKRRRSSRAATAAFSRSAGERACWFCMSRSWKGQNLPCSRAASEASAAGMAFGCMGSGWCFQTTRTCPLKASSTCLSVGSTRPQNGHWKSEKRTMVSLASAGPRAGSSARTVTFL